MEDMKMYQTIFLKVKFGKKVKEIEQKEHIEQLIKFS
jgi:hypothetical protein